MAKSFREQKGYSRINLLSRKEKDERALAQAEKNGGGIVKLKSNSISRPLAGSSFSTQLRRKQSVKVTPGVEKKVGEKTEMVTPEKTEIIPGADRKVAKAADFNDGKINIRSQHHPAGEHSGKKGTRHAIHEAIEKGDDYTKAGGYKKGNHIVYKNHKGQEELAGVEETVKDPDTIKKTPATYKTTPITEKQTRFDAVTLNAGKTSGARKYNLKFKDNGGAGVPERKYHKTSARKKMMKGSGY